MKAYIKPQTNMIAIGTMLPLATSMTVYDSSEGQIESGSEVLGKSSFSGIWSDEEEE